MTHQETGSQINAFIPVDPTNYDAGFRFDRISRLPVDTERVAEVYYDALRTATDSYGLPTFQIEQDLRSKGEAIAKGEANLGKLQSVPRDIVRSDDVKLRRAGAYFSRIVYPLIARGRDSYAPTDSDRLDFCHKLTNGGVDLVMYYALSKTQSPARTGSPDTIIDAAEIEMLRYMAVMTEAAREADLDLKVILVDETAIMPDDPFLGFSKAEKSINKSLVKKTLKGFKAEDRVVVRSLADSVVTPLGSDFPAMYEDRHAKVVEAAKKQLSEGQVTPLTIRMFTLLDIMPNSGLGAMGLDLSEIQRVRALGRQIDLRGLPSQLIDYLINTTAHVGTVMDLRSSASERVRSNGHIAEYPEYNGQTRLSGGVTRSTTRWSFLPHPRRYKGRVINPMHGLALYDGTGGEYLGVTPYHELNQLESQDQAIVVSIQGKPVFGLTK